MTKEEKQKLLAKQYNPVLEQELAVYDKAKEVQSEFTKQTKANNQEYKKQIKQIEAAEKAVVSTFDTKRTEKETAFTARIKEIDAQKAVVETTYQSDLSALTATFKTKRSDLKKQYTADKKQNEKAKTDGEKQLAKDIDTANKTIEQIKEKGVKDQATFDQKLNDLKAKYEAKIETLTEKEQTKIAKLTEANDKKIETLNQTIVKEQEKHDKQLAILVPTFEEELAEIDEKINFEKAEYDKKYANIKTSADKRIAVREKHLQRAIEDNDQRSAKQHKKDISSFEKEAEHDLVVLEKNYKQQQTVSADYRLNFIKEHYQKIADLQKELAAFVEEKQYEIDQLNVTHQDALTNTKLEYEQLRAEELNTFNNDYAQIREKQETVRHQQDVDVEQQHMNEANAKIEFDRLVKTVDEEAKLVDETYEKTLRLLDKEEETEQAIAEHKKQVEYAKLEAQKDILESEHKRDFAVIDHEQNIEYHQLQDQKHNASKTEFLQYQQLIKPGMEARAKALLDYETLELENRKKVKVAVLESELKELEKEYEHLVKEIERSTATEKTFYEDKINELAGPQKEDIQTFVEKYETELTELQNKINELSGFKDRKQRKELENKLELTKQTYHQEKQTREQEYNAIVGAYQVALDAVVHRHEDALKDAEDLHTSNTARVQQAIDFVERTHNEELELAKSRYDQIEASLNQFELQVTSRNQQHTEANQAYIDAQVVREEDHIASVNKECEVEREARKTVLDQTLAQLSDQEKNIVAQKQTFIQEQEAAYEDFKEQIEGTIDTIKQVALQEQEKQMDAFNQKKQEILTLLNQEISTIKSNLSSQTEDYNKTIQQLQKQKSEVKTNSDLEQKRIKKEFDERLKETEASITKELQKNIEAI